MHPAIILVLLALLAAPAAADDKLTVAVASNFGRTFGELAVRFYKETGIEIQTTTGSTGKIYAQVINGAPFDIFLAADAERPALLEASGNAVPGSRFTYATGRLVLWSRDAEDCIEALRTGRWVALANPKTAPYGRAAKEFLQNAGYWEDVSERVAYAENAMQVVHFVTSGNATVGFVAESLLDGPHTPAGKCAWPVPEEFHAPLVQQAVLLKHAAGNDAAQRFIEFMRSDVALGIIERQGYGVSP